MENLTKEQAADGAFAVLGTIMEMSDRVQSMGGATSMAGVAALHTLQKSLQKNGPRMAALYQAYKAKGETE